MKKRKLKFGVCADVHKDVMHDANFRLESFIEKASKKNIDFIIQMGDFCRAYDYKLRVPLNLKFIFWKQISYY